MVSRRALCLPPRPLTNLLFRPPLGHRVTKKLKQRRMALCPCSRKLREHEGKHDVTEVAAFRPNALELSTKENHKTEEVVDTCQDEVPLGKPEELVRTSPVALQSDNRDTCQDEVPPGKPEGLVGSSPVALQSDRRDTCQDEVSLGKPEELVSSSPVILQSDKREYGNDSSHELPLTKDDTEKVFSSFYGIQSIPSAAIPEPGVIFIFEKASLVPALVGRDHQILNPDEHADFLRKKKLNPYDYRPDIIHEVLLNLFGSRLNMAGRIQAVYVKTDQGQLIKISPTIRIPVTVRKFCAMMSQLFQNLNVRAKGKGGKLMQLIQNPVTKHLPANSRIIGLSHSAKQATSVRDYVKAVNKNQTLVFVIGAMAHGKIDDDYTEDLISVSGMPLSAGVCVRKICVAMERRGRII